MYHYRISYLNLTRVWFCCIDITRLDIIKNLSVLLWKTLHIFKNKKESKNRKINVQFLFVNWNLINQYEEDCLKSFGWHLKYFRWFVKNFPNIKLLCCSRYDLTWWLVAGSVAVCSWSIIECYCGLNVSFQIVISSSSSKTALPPRLTYQAGPPDVWDRGGGEGGQHYQHN